MIETSHAVFLAHQGELRKEDHLIDLFCGAGGSGGGLLGALDILGRRVQGTFVNHWDKAISIHEMNHPEHRHLKEDLFLLDPARVFPPGTQCSLLWASPQCTHFSLAKGATCVGEQERSHAFSVVDWVRHLRPEGIICENVKEFLTYGPLMHKRDADGALMWALNRRPVRSLPEKLRQGTNETEDAWYVRMTADAYQPYMVPDPDRAGEYYDAWISEMEELGYDSEHRLLRSADFGDPTIRQRIFIQFVRKDSGKRLVWPKPFAGEPGKHLDRPMRWRTAREIIDWSLRGNSVFTRAKPLAPNTFRRLAIGLVKYGLKDFLVSSAHGSPRLSDCDRRVHSLDTPLQTLTSKGERGLVQAQGEFIVPNFSERPGQKPRTQAPDTPVATVTSHGAGGVVTVQVEPFILPKDQGYDKTNVRSVDAPVSTLTTEHRGEGLATGAIIQMKGCSTAQNLDAPLTALTAQQSHYVMEGRVDMIDMRRGSGVCSSVDAPARALTAGGSHQALAEAFMFAIDQTGGESKADGTYSVDEPVRTLVTKANQTCIRLSLETVSNRFLQACDIQSVDTARATTFLGFLIEELQRRGKVDAQPWIYVYYSSGSEGKAIDEPLPTIRTKEGQALVYPVIELDGQLLKIDLFYRMLTVRELQLAMGFPEDMKWGKTTKTDVIRAIGNSVSQGMARALGMAWYAQDENVWPLVRHIYQK